jgi:hypothetical protein
MWQDWQGARLGVKRAPLHEHGPPACRYRFTPADSRPTMRDRETPLLRGLFSESHIAMVTARSIERGRACRYPPT